MRHLYKCHSCFKYTMNEVCSCGGKTILAKPLKYSPEDKFAKYRRMAKVEEYKKRGLL